MGGTRIYKRLNDGGGSRHVDLSKWRSRRPKGICVLNRRHDSITFICYSAMHNMCTGLGCFLVIQIQIKEACRASLFGI